MTETISRCEDLIAAKLFKFSHEESRGTNGEQKDIGLIRKESLIHNKLVATAIIILKS